MTSEDIEGEGDIGFKLSIAQREENKIKKNILLNNIIDCLIEGTEYYYTNNTSLVIIV